MEISKNEFNTILSDNVKHYSTRPLQKLSHFALTKISGGKENALLWSYGQFKLSPFLIIQGFLQGMYPIPNMNNAKIIDWYDPELRGTIPVQHFKIQKDLQRRLKKEKFQEPGQKFEVRINTNFKETIIACSKPRGKKTKTWLTADYIKCALELHQMGITHSVETYQNGVLVGGVVGIAINGCFASLSLFHTVDNASKIAFYYLLVKLKEDGFMLHDSGAANSWFSQYGLVNMPKEEFRRNLILAIAAPVTFSNKVPELEF